MFAGIGIIMLLLGSTPIMIMPPSAVPMIGSTSSSTSIIVGGVGGRRVCRNVLGQRVLVI